MFRKAMLFDKLFGRLFIKPFLPKRIFLILRRENDEGLEFSAIAKTLYITQQEILKEVQCFLTFMNDLSYK